MRASHVSTAAASTDGHTRLTQERTSLDDCASQPHTADTAPVRRWGSWLSPSQRSRPPSCCSTPPRCVSRFARPLACFTFIEIIAPNSRTEKVASLSCSSRAAAAARASVQTGLYGPWPVHLVLKWLHKCSMFRAAQRAQWLRLLNAQPTPLSHLAVFRPHASATLASPHHAVHAPDLVGVDPLCTVICDCDTVGRQLLPHRGLPRIAVGHRLR